MIQMMTSVYSVSMCRHVVHTVEMLRLTQACLGRTHATLNSINAQFVFLC